MKLRKFFIPFAVVASLTAVTLTACGRHHHDPEEKAEWIVHKVSKKLDLNDEQKVKLEAVKDEFMRHHDVHKAHKKEMYDKLIAEVVKPQIDQAVLLEMVDQHKTRVEEIAPGVIEKLAVFHASLNQEQKLELKEKLEKFKKRHVHDES